MLCAIDWKGKTKLMYEYKKAKAKEAEMDHEPEETNEFKPRRERVAAFLILLTSFEMGKHKTVYDDEWNLHTLLQLDGDQDDAYYHSADKICEELDMKLSAIYKADPSCDRIVLLFDESSRLKETYFNFEAFLFRCVRTWLRQKRSTRVVAVFAGTNPRMANISEKGDGRVELGSYSSRCASRREYHESGSKVNPPPFIKR